MSHFSSLIMGQLDSSSSWDETSYGRNGGQDTGILSSGVSLQEQWQLEWSCYCKQLNTFCSLMNIILRELIDFSFSPLLFVWVAGSDSILCGIRDS